MRQVALLVLLVLPFSALSLDFLVLGDFGWTLNLTNGPIQSFDAMDSYVSTHNEISFLISVGDNLYVKNETDPTMEDVNLMMSLFENRTHLKDKYIWGIRGNHDCTQRDPWFEVDNITREHPTWRMPGLYYEKRFEIAGGKRVGVLFIDSCLAICANYSFDNNSNTQHDSANNFMEDEDHRHFGFGKLNCGDSWIQQEGQKLYTWLETTLNSWESDPSLVWKFSVQHHPMFDKYITDELNLTSNLLPLLLQSKLDLYLCGHKHYASHSYYPYDQVTPTHTTLLSQPHCVSEQELFFSNYQLREETYLKGYALHQILQGSTGGFDSTPVCPGTPTMGRYTWLNNRERGGFTHVSVKEDKIIVKWINVKGEEIYRVNILNDQMF
ncbi:hypothetical protein FGO68_gene13173 [Halteria grandinella]|uniref:Calcineurin-like phosphoesterase domain-containing protein n=1 Tax=Halteria grandinella TaxID=5974 RepID=A0A8J8NLI3_HALGN|nr:hypothetical protein FGO68_gene13173 [Halteria grandinella]